VSSGTTECVLHPVGVSDTPERKSDAL
jgi:hypothetical protein